MSNRKLKTKKVIHMDSYTTISPDKELTSGKTRQRKLQHNNIVGIGKKLNKTWLVIAIFLYLPFTIMAQYNQGGFGNFFIGPHYNLSSSFQNELNSDKLIGGGLQLNTITLAYGGAGYSVRPKGVVIGGSGYAYKINADGKNGTVILNNGCGFFNVGYRFQNKRKWMGFPYMGMGGYGANFKITNTSTDKTFLIGTDTITSGKVAKYSTGGLAFDAGYALKYFAFRTDTKKIKKTGVVLGIDIGASFFPSFGKWQNTTTDKEVNSLSNPFIMSGYLRITLGWGIFIEKSKN